MATPTSLVLKGDSRIPSGSWDSHMHILDPSAYPLAKNALYMPSAHTLHDAINFEGSSGFSNIVLVQPSIYGNDNSCMLDAMKALGPARSRGVVVFDPDNTLLSTLLEWHKIGVRGVRVNLQSVGKSMQTSELHDVLKKYADVIRKLGWILQVYVPLYMVAALEHIVPQLGVRICIDHIGHPALQEHEDYDKRRDPYVLEGFSSLTRLLREGSTFLKLSAPYRIISPNHGYEELAPIAKELLSIAGKSRVVFATDWPHTRFEGLDIGPWIQKVLEWCGDDVVLIERLFKGNAEELWQAQVE